MKLTNIAAPLSTTKAQTLVLFATQEGKAVGCDAKNTGINKGLELIHKAHADGRLKAGAKEAVFFRSCDADGFSHVLVVGLGAKEKINEEVLRVGAAVAVKALTKEKVTTAAFCVQSIRRLTKNAVESGRAIAEGVLLGKYKYSELKTKKKDENEPANDYELAEIFLALDDKSASKLFGSGVDIGTILSEATNFARDLGNAPGNYLTPTILADRAQTAAKGLPIKFQALGKKEIEGLKMGCLLGVNAGSEQEPKFIIMEYFGGKKSDDPIIFVGKGLTFDSGGISIKPSAAMEEMKFDMCGGAAVIGAILAVARLKIKVNMVVLVPSTENMPSGAAVKPGDVLVAMNGKTVEVNNTDAEGRLILADALSYACAKYKPAAIVDAATLTGACVVALGNVYAGFFCKDPKFLKKIQSASQLSGERIWQLPLVDEYVEDMKGTYADLSNIGSAKGGGSSQGAAFLSQFVNEGITWAHFDIAGSAWHTGNRYAYNSDKGASGSAVRMFAQLAIDFNE